MASSTKYLTGIASFGSGIAWSDINQALAPDGQTATCGLPVPGNKSKTLVAKGFGFAIPSVATILGIELEIKCACTGNQDVKDYFFMLTRAGSPAGNCKASAEFWPASLTWIAHPASGAETDLWGVAWSPSDINHSLFGAWISAQAMAVGGTMAHVDSLARITIYYSLPGRRQVIAYGVARGIGRGAR